MDDVVGGYGATTVLHETSFEVHRNAVDHDHRAQRRGQVHGDQGDLRDGPGAFGPRLVRRRRHRRSQSDRAAATWHQLRAARSQRVPEDVGAGQPRARRGEPGRPVAHPRSGRTASPSNCSRCCAQGRQAGRHAERRRAEDAGDRPSDVARTAPAAHRRAVDRAVTDPGAAGLQRAARSSAIAEPPC